MSIQQRELGAGRLVVLEPRNNGKEWIGVAGEAISKDQIVCCKGVASSHVQVFKADQGAATTRQAPLFVAMHAAATGEQLRLSEMTVVTGNTAAGSAGAPVFLGTAGAWQVASPANPIAIGVILTVGASGYVLLKGTR